MIIVLINIIGKTKNIPQGAKNLISFKKNGEYTDEITNIVYNETKMKNIINKKIKILNNQKNKIN